MFCKNCGREIDNRAVVCPYCGVMQTELAQAEKKKPVNGLGIAGFVVSILSLYFSVFFCIASVIGIILSAIGVAQKEKHSVNGLAIAGLVISFISLFVWGIVWIVVGAQIFSVL